MSKKEKVFAKGYKGFDPGWSCLGKKYSVNTVFEESGGEICEAGVMHFCRKPLDVLTYYPPLNEDGELNKFAEVIALSECQEGRDKSATTKLKVCREVDIAELIAAADSGAELSITTIDHEHSATTGTGADSFTAGMYAHSGTSGAYSRSYTAGYRAYSCTTGMGSHSHTTGNCAHSCTTGRRSESSTSGKNAIAAALGDGGWARAALGSFIVLAEYDEDSNLIAVKSAKVDGKTILPNTYYKLVNGEFVAVE